MNLDKLALNDILGECDEEDIETLRQMRLARVRNGVVVKQKATVSEVTVGKTKKVMSLDVKHMSDDEKKALIALLEGMK